MKWDRDLDTKGAVKVADKNSLAVAYFYPANQNGRVVIKCYQAKRQKPDAHYQFNTLAKAQRWVADYFKNVQATEAYKVERQARTEAKCAAIDVGDVYYTSWGYDQTNINFYMVTGRTEKTVKYVPVGKALDHNDGAACDYVTPNADYVGATERTAKITATGFKADGYYAYKYNDQPLYETAAGWGH